MKRKYTRQQMCEKVEDTLYNWFVDVQSLNIPISGQVLIVKAETLLFF